MNKGKLIVIEGACDGMGKSTQISLLHDRLEKEGHTIVRHHFPTYGTYHGKPVEMYLKGELGEKITDTNPYFVNSLYAVDRGCAWYGDLKEKYDRGDILLFDRYTTSSLIYQAAIIENLEERKAFIDFVVDFEYNKIAIPNPEQVIFLYAPFDLVTELRNKRVGNDGIANDIFEKDIEYMKKIYENSMFVADYLGWDFVKCDNDDGMCSIEEIHEKVYKLVKTRNKI